MLFYNLHFLIIFKYLFLSHQSFLMNVTNMILLFPIQTMKTGVAFSLHQMTLGLILLSILQEMFVHVTSKDTTISAISETDKDEFSRLCCFLSQIHNLQNNNSRPMLQETKQQSEYDHYSYIHEPCNAQVVHKDSQILVKPEEKSIHIISMKVHKLKKFKQVGLLSYL